MTNNTNIQNSRLWDSSVIFNRIKTVPYMRQVCKIARKYGNKYFLTENKSRTVRAMLCFWHSQFWKVSWFPKNCHDLIHNETLPSTSKQLYWKCVLLHSLFKCLYPTEAILNLYFCQQTSKSLILTGCLESYSGKNTASLRGTGQGVL